MSALRRGAASQAIFAIYGELRLLLLATCGLDIGVKAEGSETFSGLEFMARPQIADRIGGSSCSPSLAVTSTACCSVLAPARKALEPGGRPLARPAPALCLTPLPNLPTFGAGETVGVGWAGADWLSRERWAGGESERSSPAIRFAPAHHDRPQRRREKAKQPRHR